MAKCWTHILQIARSNSTGVTFCRRRFFAGKAFDVNFIDIARVLVFSARNSNEQGLLH